MKKIIFALIGCGFAFMAIAQSNVPPFVTFQGVARDSNDIVVDSGNIDVALIYQYGANGPILYNCDYHKLTDNFGEFTILISDTSSDLVGNCPGFSSIPWDTGNIYLTVKYSTDGGGTYILLGTIPISSTYYALVARQAETVRNFNLSGAVAGQIMQFDGANWTATNSGVPVGTITAFAGPLSNLPTGWLSCDGSIKDTSLYSKLYAVIGTYWGNANGDAGYFTLPDLRGQFLRGVSDISLGSSNPDPDEAGRNTRGSHLSSDVGSYQLDAFQDHSHYPTPLQNANYQNVNFASTPSNTYTIANGPGVTNQYQTTGNVYPPANVANLSNETRPKNVYVNYIIKY